MHLPESTIYSGTLLNTDDQVLGSFIIEKYTTIRYEAILKAYCEIDICKWSPIATLPNIKMKIKQNKKFQMK